MRINAANDIILTYILLIHYTAVHMVYMYYMLVCVTIIKRNSKHILFPISYSPFHIVIDAQHPLLFLYTHTQLLLIPPSFLDVYDRLTHTQHSVKPLQ